MKQTLLGLIALTLVACATAEPALPNGTTVDFRDDEAAEFDPRTFDGQAAAIELNDAQRQVVDRIAADPAAFLASAPPTDVLNEAEMVFFAAGRLFELTGWYADAVEGGNVGLRPRLAWSYARTGLHSEAVREAERAVEETPDNAEAWFVLGYVHGQSQGADDELLEKVADAFSRAAELDPDFVGPGGVTASDIRRQATEIRTALNRRQAPAPAPNPTNPHGAGAAPNPHAGVRGAPPLTEEQIRAGAPGGAAHGMPRSGESDSAE